ncbi:MAG: YkgJ family cysteine cluster protein [Candidatus Gastranaerophilaceae bacterium]|jgi:Fe-S-cluster containining protein
MNKLIHENKNNRLVYRELFFKANDAVKKQLNSVKTPSFCNKCKTCCKIRYSELSPLEIYELSKKEDKITTRYIELFAPYGAKKDFNYKSDIDIKLNHSEAEKINNNYVKQVVSKHQKPVYFYFCRFLDENKNCLKNYDKSLICSGFPDDVKIILPQECGFRKWQTLALQKINTEISKDICRKLNEINLYRDSFSCRKCGTCCKLASSEFSFEELKTKAQNGDNFASQFTSVFIPYENLEEAKTIFPEFVDMIFQKLGNDEKVYFYYCPHLTKANLCSDYDNRPEVCRVFPNNPLVIFHPSCGYYEWKEDVHVAAMLMHALIEICEFNEKKINFALKD